MTKKDIDYFVKKYTIDNYYTLNEISYKKAEIENAGFTAEEIQKAVEKYREQHRQKILTLSTENTKINFIIVKRNENKINRNLLLNFSNSILNLFPKLMSLSNHYIYQEALASSTIEGAISKLDQIIDMITNDKEPTDKSELMIKNNATAITYVWFNFKQPLTHELIDSLHKVIMDGLEKYDSDLKPEHIGFFRGEPISVLARSGSGKILYEPNNHNSIYNMMTELINWVNNKKNHIPGLYKAIIFHFLFGYIHPYIDGNGRTARVLQIFLLFKFKQSTFATLPCSEYIIKHLKDYDEAFLKVERNQDKEGNYDITYFIDYMLTSYSETIQTINKNRPFLIELLKQIYIKKIINPKS